MKAKEPLFEYISPDIDYQIKVGDSLTVLQKIEDGKFDLILTSPPYNVGKSYETKTSIEKYLATQEVIIKELVRTLSDKGNLCWQAGNYVDKGEIFPLDIYYYQIFKKFGLKLRNRIIWPDMDFTLQTVLVVVIMLVVTIFPDYLFDVVFP